MEEALIQVPAEMTKASTMAHGALRLVFDTQEELTDTEVARLMTLRGKIGYLCFLPESKKIDVRDVVNLPPIEIEKDERSPGFRLRSSLFRLWEFKGKPTPTFNEFYFTQMERFITAVQERIV